MKIKQSYVNSGDHSNAKPINTGLFDAGVLVDSSK